jgi:hypothetical protein
MRNAASARALDRNHGVAAVRGEQFVQDARKDAAIGTTHRQIDEGSIRDPDLLGRKTCDHLRTRRDHFDRGETEPIDDHGSSTAAHGQGADTATLSGPMPEHELRGFEQRLEDLDPQDAVGLEERFGDVVGTRHRAGMRGRDFATDSGAPELERDHGFACVVGASRRVAKHTSVTKCFQEKEDGAGVRVVHQQMRELADPQVALVADRNQLGETQSPLLCA